MTAYALKNGSIRSWADLLPLWLWSRRTPCDMAMIDREEEGALARVHISRWVADGDTTGMAKELRWRDRGRDIVS